MAAAVLLATFAVARDGRPDLDGLARMQDWFLRRGMQEKRMNLDQAVDLSFLPR